MNRSHNSRRLCAALAAAAVVATAAVATLGSPVGAAPAPSRAQAVPPQRVPLSRPKAPAAPEGRGAPALSPRQAGPVGVLLELDADSTLTTFRAAAAQGAAAAASAAKAQFARITQAQQQVVAALPQAAPGARVLYRAHSVLAGVAVLTDAANLPKLQQLAGVRAVHPIAPKAMANTSAVPLVGAPQAWTAYGDTGQDSTIAVIDSGLDYTHADFGGPGTTAAFRQAEAHNTEAVDPALFSAAKFRGGFDLAGDDYNASADPTDPSTGSLDPAPDPNPLDCGGHGSHVAGIAAGYGVTADGGTYAGPYNTDTPFSTLRVGPGVAPKAGLYSYRVFGCTGTTLLVADAVDQAVDPNGDGDPSDHVNVINLSLGSDLSNPDDTDGLAVGRAVDLGVNVVAIAGNGGDLYEFEGSPGNQVKVIGVANSMDASTRIDALSATTPAGTRDYGASRAVAYHFADQPDLSGPLVALTDPANADGCLPYSAADKALVAGKVAFLEWTDDNTTRRCGSAARGVNAVAAGATGYLLASDIEDVGPGITGSAVIPAVLVVKSAGDALRAALTAGATVNGTKGNAFTIVRPGDIDKVNPSSGRGAGFAGDVKPDVTAVGTTVFSAAAGTGSDGDNLTGTSMATPMVAGEAALLATRHPDWTPLEIKADIVNTAGQDLYLGDNHTGPIYGPNRVGAGRIQVKPALDNQVLAYNADNSGSASVSFGPQAVTAPTTLAQQVTVANKGDTAAAYTLSYQAATSVPGVTFRATAPGGRNTVQVPAHATATVSVALTMNPAAMTKTIDPTVDREQRGVPRSFHADASGRIVLTPTTGTQPALRVPVYVAPRPASTMTQPGTLTMPAGPVQTADLALSGHGVQQGTGAEAIQSLVAAFELQAASPQLPQCGPITIGDCIRLPEDRAADIRYVGSTSDALQQPGGTPMDGFAYFAISTHQPWLTEGTKDRFEVRIDTDGDNVPDVAVSNERLGGLEDEDVFVSQAVDLHTGAVLDVEPVNTQLGDVDTAEFDSDVMVLPVALSSLPGIRPGHSRLRYGVRSFISQSPVPIDRVGIDPAGNLGNALSFDPLAPGVSTPGAALLARDMPNTTIAVRRDAAAYTTDQALGVLVAHFHNTPGNKAQVVTLTP